MEKIKKEVSGNGAEKLKLITNRAEELKQKTN